MQLWTWQSKKFSLADENQPYIPKHSRFFNDSINRDIREKERHLAAYKEMWKLLGTDQLIWCYKNLQEALDNSNLEYKDCLLWELDMPENKIKWYCGAAWNMLRTGKPLMPSGLEEITHSSEPLLPQFAENYRKNFNSYWAEMPTNDLLRLMFLKKPVLDLGLPNARTPGCCESIVIHPVGEHRITKNPLKIGNWWTVNNKRVRLSSPNKNRNLVEKIPCHQCPGR